MNKRDIYLMLYALNRLERETRLVANTSKWKLWTKAERDEVERHAKLADELSALMEKVRGIECE